VTVMSLMGSVSCTVVTLGHVTPVAHTHRLPSIAGGPGSLEVQ
jgi:hypothetical protein